MYRIETTPVYDRWFAKLRDRKAQIAVDTRVRRLALGNPGDVKFVVEAFWNLGSISDQVTGSTI